MVLLPYSGVNTYRVAGGDFTAVIGFINKLHKMSVNVYKKIDDESIAEFNTIIKRCS